MSFSGTPLGQGRRLDHHTFLNKTNPKSSYGAPSRSPPKSPGANDNDPALVRFARQKQRSAGASVGPRIITSPPAPDKWAVKDTSVNIATAFHQAADMQSSNPNNSWASGSQPANIVPRSTSVEYEKETQSTISRRLAAPPSRRTAAPVRKPISKDPSIRHVPDSEGEDPDPSAERSAENSFVRGKSPFEQVVDAAKRALGPATFFLRQPEDHSLSSNGSYDYSAEEREFQASQAQSQLQSQQTAASKHKRGKISMDNKAYRPPASDFEDTDDDITDGEGKKGRRKKSKKKGPPGGPLTDLPVAGYGKRRKKKTKGAKNGTGEEEEGDEGDETGSDEQSEQQSATQRPSVPRGSVLRTSVLRDEIPQYDTMPIDDLLDMEQGLQSIAEEPEPELGQSPEPPKVDGLARARSMHITPPPTFSIGATLGTLVYNIFCFASSSLFLFGHVIGSGVDTIIGRPIRWLVYARAHPGPAVRLLRLAFLGLVLAVALYFLREPIALYLPSSFSFGSDHQTPLYQPPTAPAADIAELSARLQRLEGALSGLTLEHERSRTAFEREVRGRGELMGRVGAVEARVQDVDQRAIAGSTEQQAQVAATGQGLQSIRHEVDSLRALVQAQEGIGQSPVAVSDEETKAKLHTLEERVDSMEGGVKEALELGKQLVKMGGATSGPAWWNRIGSGSTAGLTIKSTDGQDVTALLERLVDNAVTHHAKDVLARPDYAAYAGGGRVIPALTSSTFEIRPQTRIGQALGLLTGNGYAVGRPPVTALNHDLHTGHCWPFATTEGQVGVSLAAPAHIDSFTIDHVAKEVAFDMRSAPRDMEVWAFVEGAENIAKVHAWQAERAWRREEGLDVEDDPEYPATLPNPQYIRLARFTYDIHAPRNIQTFPVDSEIRELGLDFGITVLRVLSNWGQDEFTCLYRFRVHAQPLSQSQDDPDAAP